MKRALLLFGMVVLICLLACRTATAKTEVTVYCIDNYPPYSYTMDGEAMGLYPAILTKAFSRMEGYRVTLLPVPWKRGLHYVRTGEGFAIVPVYYKPRLRPYIWPYSTPILREEVVLLCRDAILRSMPRHRWPEDFHGLSIGKNAGFATGGEAFDEAVRLGDITLDEAQSNRINLMKLGLKRIDCYVNDRLSIVWELTHLKREGLYDEGGKHALLGEDLVINSEWCYLGFTRMDFGRFHFKDDFILKFNTVIRGMQENGEIKSIIKQFMTSPH